MLHARLFLASFCNDPQLLAIVQFHDEHLAMWQKVKRRGQFDRARFERLLQAITDWNTHLAFIIIDGCTPGKSSEPLLWFFRKIKNKVQTKWTEKDILKTEVFEPTVH